MQAIDLHVHSNCSDGTFSPTQLVDYAMEKGLKAFALTDHDTVSGLDNAIRYAETLLRKTDNGAFGASGEVTSPALAGKAPSRAGSVPEVIPGIEFSTEYEGQDIHIVGLYISNRYFPKLEFGS